MKFLSVDTSTKYSVVALSDEYGMIYGTRHLFEKGRSDGLSALIEYSLKRARIKETEIGYFGVGVGPGSFTGLRIGLSTVKGLSYALNKKCLAFSSLDAIAFNRGPYSKERLCVLVDARRSNVYCRLYDTASGSKSIKPISKVSLSVLPSLVKYLKGQLAFSGDALQVHKGELKKRIGRPASIQFMPEEFWYPTPESIAELTRRSLKEKGALTCFQLSAVYLYAQDCQVNPVREIH